MSGIDESARGLTDVLHVKRRVSEMLRAILKADPDEWNLQIGGDEPGCIYVQGVQEDDGCIHLELVHESVAARQLGNEERDFLEQASWQPPNDDIPNYWVFLEAGEWTPPDTALFLAESLDRVYHAFDPRVTDGTVSVMPMDLAVEVMGDDEPMVAIKLPGNDEGWEPVWREGELEAVPADEVTPRPVLEPVRLVYPAPRRGEPLAVAPSMPRPTTLMVLIGDGGEPTNLLFMTDGDTWTRRDGRWISWLIDDESDDPRDRFEGTSPVHVDPPFIDMWDRGGITADLVRSHGYTFSMESGPRGDVYVYVGPSVDYAGDAAVSQLATPRADISETEAPLLPQAGWYADPWRQARLRWWDGKQWTGHTH